MKELSEFPNYAIDSQGMVWNIKRSKSISRFKDNTGYYQSELSRDGKKYKRRIHSLMAQTYLTKPFEKACVNHKDGNKLNNEISNLEYVSNSENTRHAYEKGLYRSRTSLVITTTNKETGEKEAWKSIRSMCEVLGINRKTVSSILTGSKVTNNYKYEFNYVD